MGDINIPDHGDEYNRVIRNSEWSDAWKILHPNEKGYTYDHKANQLVKYFDSDADKSERLDYILYYPRPSFHTVVKSQKCEIVKFKDSNSPPSKGWDLSDHYGVVADFELEYRPVGTITYWIDALREGAPPELTKSFEPAILRSFLAWMEHVAVGYVKADISQEAPLIRVSILNSEDYPGCNNSGKIGGYLL